MRPSHECRATVVRQSRDIFSKLDRTLRICRINVYSMRLQRESCVYIVYLCREIVANYLRTSLQLSYSSEIGAIIYMYIYSKVQVGNDQEKTQSENRFPLLKPRREKN